MDLISPSHPCACVCIQLLGVRDAKSGRADCCTPTMTTTTEASALCQSTGWYLRNTLSVNTAAGNDTIREALELRPTTRSESMIAGVRGYPDTIARQTDRYDPGHTAAGPAGVPGDETLLEPGPGARRRARP